MDAGARFCPEGCGDAESRSVASNLGSARTRPSTKDGLCSTNEKRKKAPADAVAFSWATSSSMSARRLSRRDLSSSLHWPAPGRAPSTGAMPLKRSVMLMGPSGAMASSKPLITISGLQRERRGCPRRVPLGPGRRSPVCTSETVMVFASHGKGDDCQMRVVKVSGATARTFSERSRCAISQSVQMVARTVGCTPAPACAGLRSVKEKLHTVCSGTLPSVTRSTSPRSWSHVMFGEKHAVSPAGTVSARDVFWQSRLVELSVLLVTSTHTGLVVLV
mmetsp:Transcript_41594/g.98654  ORF Transcript_41594/g.98654 Transcript_41594/m.98654 type:complete len:276 (+) Transcript_41594:2395-3222(+)